MKDETSKCEMILYEHCETIHRDPLYRLSVKKSSYFDMFENIQIDYYNTLEDVGHTRTGEYDRTEAVQQLDNKYREIAEHYVIESRLDKVYLHHDHDDKRSDFLSTLIDKIIIAGSSLKWQLFVIRTKERTIDSYHLPYTLIDQLIDSIQNNENHKETMFSTYDGEENVSDYHDMPYFCVTFVWNDTEHVSTLYVSFVSQQDVFHKTIIKEDEDDEIRNNIYQHSIQYYKNVRELLYPCSVCPLMNFDVSTRSISLTIRPYDYKSVWIVFDTTDVFPYERTVPYIDTTFLRLIKDVRRICTNEHHCKRLQLIYEEQFRNKLKRLISEKTKSNNKSNNILNDLWEKDADEIENTVNRYTPLGLLFHVLGTTNSCLHFNNARTSDMTTRFHTSFVKEQQFSV